MRIINYLFFHVYELALNSESNRDMPMLITVPIVTVCFMFNAGALIFILQGADLITSINFFPKSERIVGGLLFFSFTATYYLYKKRYVTIYERYKSKQNRPFSALKSAVIVIAYYLVSFGILLLAGLYKNHDWIFAD